MDDRCVCLLNRVLGELPATSSFAWRYEISDGQLAEMALLADFGQSHCAVDRLFADDPDDLFFEPVWADSRTSSNRKVHVSDLALRFRDGRAGFCLAERCWFIAKRFGYSELRLERIIATS